MQPHHTNYWTWKDKEFRFDIFISDNFDNLKNVKQVYGLVLDKSETKILIVHNKSGLWILPGGGIEEGETYIDTLVREVKEETNRDIELSTVKPLFYQKSYAKNTQGEWEFKRIELRYSVKVKNDNEFISDHDNGDTVEVKWVKITDLAKYLDWGETVGMIISILANK